LLDLALNNQFINLINPFSQLTLEKIMALKKRHVSFLVLVLAWCLGAMACKGTIIGETAYVVSEKADVRNSTSKANNSVGGLKRGDEVTIIERSSQGESASVKIKGPEGIEGWTSPINLATKTNADKSREMAGEIAGISAQAECTNRKSVKLRSTPDRSSDANVIVQLPAGAVFEVTARETKPKMVDPAAKVALKTEADDPNKTPESTYEVWFKVRVKDNEIVPAGYVWQRLGTVKDSKGIDSFHYVIFEKSVPSADEKSDFDYVHIIGFDAKNRSVSYYNVLREDMRGVFPVKTSTEGLNVTFSFDSLDAANNKAPITYTVQPAEKGRLKADRPGLPSTAKR
jgi:hypothetical protein